MKDPRKRGNQRSLSDFFKWLTALLLFVTALFALFIYVFLDPLVRKRIEREVNEASEGLYILKIEYLDARFWSGAITMKEVSLRPNYNVLKVLQARDTSDYIPDVNLFFDSVNISRIGWFKYLLNNEKLEVGEVLIDNPDFIVTTELEGSTVKQESRNFLDLLPGIIAAFTGSLRIEEIVVTNGHLHYDLLGKEGIIHQLADSVFIDLQKIRIDTLAQNNALYSEKASFSFLNYRLIAPDSLTLFKIARIHGTVHDSAMAIENVYYFQKDSVKEMYPDKLEVKVNNVFSRGMDYGNLLKEQKIFLRTMILKNPQVNMVSSEDPVKKYEVKDEENGRSVLDDLVPYLSGSFRIDTLVADNGNIQYLIRNDEKSVYQKANEIDLLFSRVLVDTLRTGQKVFAEDVRLDLKDYMLEKDTTSRLAIASLKASLSDSMFHFSDIRFHSIKDGDYQVAADAFRGAGVDFISAFVKRKGRADTLLIESPVMRITSVLREGEEKPADTSSLANQSIQEVFYSLLGDFADASLHVGKFFVRDGYIHYNFKSGSNVVEQKADKLFIVIDSIRIDSTRDDINKFYQDFFVRMNDYEVKVHKENFSINIDAFSACSEKKYIKLKNIEMNQLSSFGEKQRFYFTNSIDEALASGFHFEELIEHQKLNISLLDVQRMNLEVHLDVAKSELRPEYIRKMPNEMLRSLDMYLRIDTMKIKDSYVVYVNQDPVVEEPGKLFFDRIEGTVVNLTNDSLLMTAENPARLHACAKLMGEADLELQVELALLEEKLNGTYQGTVGSVQGKTFNEFLIFAGIQVEEGKLDSSRFHATITDNQASGQLLFVYDELKVEVVDPATEKVSRLKSLLGNLIVKNSNPEDEDEKPEEVELSATVQDDDSFFYFLWRVLREGVVKTVTKDALFDLVNKQ